MKKNAVTALAGLGLGGVLVATFVATVLYVSNDMRWLLLLGSVGFFLGGLWLGRRRGSGVVAFLLFCLPLLLLFALRVVPELPGLWPHLPIWLAFALLGWWGFRPGARTVRAAGLGVLIVALVASWYAAARVPAAISAALNRTLDEPAPAFAFESHDGAQLGKNTFQGKVVVLDFFATWCAPCIAELPEIDSIYRRYAGQDDVAVLVVANLSGGDTPDKIRAFLDGRDVAVPFVLDAGAEAHEAFGFSGLPGLILIDRSGHVRFRREGYNAAETDFQERVIELVEQLRVEARTDLPPALVPRQGS